MHPTLIKILYKAIEVLKESAFIVDHQGNIVACNKLAETAFNVPSAGSLIGDKLNNLTQQPLSEKILQQDVTVPSIREHSKLRKYDGSEFLADTEAVPLSDENNNLLGFMLIIHEQKLEAEMEQLTSAFKEKITGLGSTICHEVRNFLQGTMTCSVDIKENVSQIEMVTHKIKETARVSRNIKDEVENINALLSEIKERLEIIDTCSKTQDTLTKNVLDLAKLESKTVKVDYTIFHLQKLILNMKYIFSQQLKDKSLQLGFDLPQDDMMIKTDEGKLTQIINNLISNSIKYTKNGGHIFISASVKIIEASKIELSVSVSDTGIGMSKEVQNKLFEPFYQAANEQETGFGLGLPTCKGLIEVMRGSLSIQSEEGKGSTVSFSIPAFALTKDEILEYEKKFVQENRELAKIEIKQKLNFLIVEDNVVNQKIFCYLLKTIDANCTIASNTSEALKKYKPLKYDFILMDINLPGDIPEKDAPFNHPGENGFYITQKIRQIEKESNTKRTHIIGISANIGDYYQERAKIADMDAYLEKPVTKAHLLNTIQTCLKAEPLSYERYKTSTFFEERKEEKREVRKKKPKTFHPAHEA